MSRAGPSGVLKVLGRMLVSPVRGFADGQLDCSPLCSVWFALVIGVAFMAALPVLLIWLIMGQSDLPQAAWIATVVVVMGIVEVTIANSPRVRRGWTFVSFSAVIAARLSLGESVPLHLMSVLATVLVFRVMVLKDCCLVSLAASFAVLAVSLSVAGYSINADSAQKVADLLGIVLPDVEWALTPNRDNGYRANFEGLASNFIHHRQHAIALIYAMSGMMAAGLGGRGAAGMSARGTLMVGLASLLVAEALVLGLDFPVLWLFVVLSIPVGLLRGLAETGSWRDLGICVVITWRVLRLVGVLALLAGFCAWWRRSQDRSGQWRRPEPDAE